MPNAPDEPPRAPVGLAGKREPATREPATRDRPAGASRRGAPLPLAAAIATLWAAAVSTAPVLALAVAGAWGSASPPATVARLAAGGWLLAHGVPVSTPDDVITLPPLALTALALWRLARAGVHTNRATGGHRVRAIAPAVRAAVAVALVYAGLGYAVASLAESAEVDLSRWRVVVTLGVFAGLAALAGALTHARSGRRAAVTVPAVLRDAVRTGLAAAALVVAAGAIAAGVTLARSGGAGAQMLGTYRAGVLGQAGITALCLAYLPNLAIWAAAYLLGPGFAVGTGTIVSPVGVALGPVPGLPVFAALPSAPLTGAGLALLGVPVLAGVAAGWLIGRRSPRTWSGRLGAAVLAGPVAGAMLQAACHASAGALGSGRLSVMGPTDDWRIGVIASFVVGLGTVVGSLVAGLRR